MSYIELHYGPYSANGTIKHRTNRLMNLYNYLREQGNWVELIPSIHLDLLEVVVGLRVAFQCRITFLSQLSYQVFGKNHDPTLVRAIEATEETIQRIGQVGPNMKIPGMYKEMFRIFHDFGSGIIHNNYPEVLEELKVEDDEDYSIESENSFHGQTRSKSIKFMPINY